MRQISLTILLVFTAQLVLGWPRPMQPQTPECRKSYRVTGTGIDGQAKNFVVQLWRPTGEPGGFDPVLEEDANRKFYSPGYRITGSPTYKQNCAGLVMERHFGIGNTYFSADQFVREILSVFAEEVSSGYQAGDVVVFGSNKHVAYVTGPGSTASRANIVSKDNQESIIEGELTLTGTSNFFGSDPIKNKNGSPRVYRFRSKPALAEVAAGNCDPATLPDLTVIIDVNEILKSGERRDLSGASVTLTLSNGEKITGSAGAKGEATFTIVDNPPGRGAAARAGMKVKVTFTGFRDKEDSIPGSQVKDNLVAWSMTLTRNPDNPEEADPNIMPGGVNPVDLAEWEKKLKEIEARIAVAEGKKADFIKRSTNSPNIVAKVTAAETKARSLLDDLKKLKAAVDRVEQLCKDATKTNKDMEAIAKAIATKEKEVTDLTDSILALIDKCATSDDVKKIRDDTVKLRKLIDDLVDPVKEARKLNDELKRLQTESLKELPELSKGAGLIKAIHEQEDIAGQAFKDAMDDYAKLSALETEIKNAKFALSSELFKHRQAYPTSSIPPATEQRLDGLNARIEALVAGVSSGQPAVDVAKTLGNLATISGEADALVKQYQNAVCTITPRDDLLDRIVESVTFAGLGLQTIVRSEEKVKQCESRLDCDSQIRKINEALDIGDLEGATVIIARIKNNPCDTSAVEKRWTDISNKISFDLATAKNRWRDIASTCDYRGAYEAALVIQKQYPKHPWIVANFPDIERGYRAEQQIRGLVDNLIVADKARNYDEAEKILAQIDGIAAAYPCMVAEAKKLRTEYGKGKPASAEEERNCRDLIGQVRQAIAGKRLLEASQKLAEAQKTCRNVSPALFTDLQAVEREFEQALQQAVNDIHSAAAKCEYEGAYKLAQQINQIRPALISAAELEQLRPKAEAQDKARVFLIPGLEAIKNKDVKGAIASLKQAQAVPGVPQCLLDQINSLLKELEKRQSFTDLTEQVQAATQKCDYKEAARLLAQIKLISPREDYITDWLRTNEPILTDLQTRERNAINLLGQAEGLTNTADKASTTEPVNWTSVGATLEQATSALIQAEKEAPKCLQERQQMEALRKRVEALAKRKPSEIAASIVLLIDTSGSMKDDNKINQAKDAARRAARQVSKTTEMAILHFDGDCSPSSMQPASGFTTDLNTLLTAIDGLQPGGGTPMYLSTAAAVKYAQEHGHGKNRNVILMSDGADTCRDQQAQASASIRTSNIPVSTIGFDVGNNQQAQGDLNNISSMTGGRSFSASAADPREIIRAFNLAMLPSLLKDFDFSNAAADIAGYFSQAKSMVQQQNISGALMMLKQANNLAPDSPNLNYNLSLLYEADDQLIPAVNHANNYLRLAPNAVDRSDVENRVADIQKELQKNPRAIMDSSGCRDVLTWAQAERDAARSAKNTARIQAALEISIAAQRGDCGKARALANDYKQRYR